MGSPTNATLKADLLAAVAAAGKYTKDMTEGGAMYSTTWWQNYWQNGIYCANCEFFDATNNTCSIVDGYIWNYGACRFFIIPDSKITPTVYTPTTYVAPQQTTGFDMTSMMNMIMMVMMLAIMMSMMKPIMQSTQ
jgi:hypothetical protein